jgi:hypothetical protein
MSDNAREWCAQQQERQKHKNTIPRERKVRKAALPDYYLRSIELRRFNAPALISLTIIGANRINHVLDTRR